MALTVTSFIATLGTLSISGVTSLTELPTRVNAADLPIGFPRLPTTGNEIATFTGVGSLRNLSCEYVILIQPVPLSNTATNYAAAATAIDNLYTTLSAEMAANVQIDSWSSQMTIETLGDISYWAIVTQIEASE